MATDTLVPTAEEIARARDAFAMALGAGNEENPMIQDQARIYALCRQYPDIAPLVGKLNLEAPRGFGSIDVGLPNDPTFVHVVLGPEEFLDYALKGEIALDENGYPNYTGVERLRG